MSRRVQLRCVLWMASTCGRRLLPVERRHARRSFRKCRIASSTPRRKVKVRTEEVSAKLRAGPRARVANAWCCCTDSSRRPSYSAICGAGGMAIRAGSMKLLVGYPGDERHLAIPTLAPSAVAFGKTGGKIENGTVNHAVAPGFQGAVPKSNSSLCGGRLTQTSYCLFDVSLEATLKRWNTVERRSNYCIRATR